MKKLFLLIITLAVTISSTAQTNGGVVLSALEKATKSDNFYYIKYLAIDIDKDGTLEVFVEDEDGAQMAFAFYDGAYHKLVQTETMEDNLFYTNDGFIGNTFDVAEEGSTIWSYKLKNGHIIDNLRMETEVNEDGDIISAKYYIMFGGTYTQTDEKAYQKKAPQKEMIFVRQEESWHNK